MTIECYESQCLMHSGDGPFCNEAKCVKNHVDKFGLGKAVRVKLKKNVNSSVVGVPCVVSRTSPLWYWVKPITELEKPLEEQKEFGPFDETELE